jgi:hypothetical protein
MFGMKKSPVRKGYGYDTLQPLQVLVVPTFVTRRLHICKDARDPSGETTEVLMYGFQHFHFIGLTGFFTEWLHVKRFEVD